jgi:hypothetical protein
MSTEAAKIASVMKIVLILVLDEARFLHTNFVGRVRVKRMVPYRGMLLFYGGL